MGVVWVSWVRLLVVVKSDWGVAVVFGVMLQWSRVGFGLKLIRRWCGL